MMYILTAVILATLYLALKSYFLVQKENNDKYSREDHLMIWKVAVSLYVFVLIECYELCSLGGNKWIIGAVLLLYFFLVLYFKNHLELAVNKIENKGD